MNKFNDKFNDKEMKLANFFIKKEGKGILKLLKKGDLFSLGILDSLDLMNLVMFVEKEFNKKLDITNKKDFNIIRNFNLLYNFINKK